MEDFHENLIYAAMTAGAILITAAALVAVNRHWIGPPIGVQKGPL